MKHINVSVKIIVPVKTIIVRILTCICENGKYLKLFFYDLRIVSDDTVLYVMDIVSINCIRKYYSNRFKKRCVSKS